jgi:hypothetical protein
MGKRAGVSERLRRRRQVEGFELECGQCGATLHPTHVQEGPGGDSFWYAGQCACGAVVQGMVGDDSAVREFAAFVSGYELGAGYGVPQARWYEPAVDWVEKGYAGRSERH